jgi:hypothetical protein
MEMYREVEVQLHVLLKAALDWAERSVSRPGRGTRDTDWPGGWAVPRANLLVAAKTEIPACLRFEPH